MTFNVPWLWVFGLRALVVVPWFAVGVVAVGLALYTWSAFFWFFAGLHLGATVAILAALRLLR